MARELSEDGRVPTTDCALAKSMRDDRLVSSSLSSFLRCLKMRNITPIHTSKAPQSESAVSHEASIFSVHWQCRVDIFVIIMEIYYLRACELPMTLFQSGERASTPKMV